MRRCLICVSLALSFSLSSSTAAAAAQAPDLSLGDAQRIALANHPTIRISQFDVAAAREGITIARSAYHPQAYGEAVQSFAGPGTRISAYNALSDPTVIRRTAVGVGVSQYITDFGRTADLVQASEADLHVQAANTMQSKNLVLLDVTQSYFEVLRSAALVTVAQQTINERKTLLARIRALQHAGLRSMLDVSIAERDLASSQQLLLQAQGRQRDAYSTLSTAMGFNSLHVYTLANINGLPAVPTLTPLLSSAMADNPALAASQARGAAARYRANAVSRNAYPTLNAYGFFGVTPLRPNPQVIGSSYSAAGVSLNIPIFTGGELQAQRRQAIDAANAAIEETRSEENQLLGDIRTAYDAVQTARGNIGLSHTLLATAQEALRFTAARYRIGLSSIADVSEAQLAEEQDAIGQVNATYDYIVQAASLEYATGLLAGSDLFPGNADMSSPGSAPLPLPNLKASR